MTLAALPPASGPQPPPIPWEDIRRLYVQGIPTGPGLPDQSELLASVGEGDVFDREASRVLSQSSHPRPRGSYAKITTVGRIKVVFPNVRGVANHFGVPERIVSERARDENWYDLQRLWRAQLRKKSGDVRTQQRLREVERIDKRALSIAQLGLQMVHARMTEMRETVDVVQEGGQIIHTGGDSREMESLARSAQVWHALGRRALGFPVDKVGVMGAADAVQLADIGLGPLDGIEPDGPELLEALGMGSAVPGLTGDGPPESEGSQLMGMDKPSVAAELAKDDAERLHGFLTVLGRAQEASRAEDESALPVEQVAPEVVDSAG